MTRRLATLVAVSAIALLASGCGAKPVRPGELASASPASGPASASASSLPGAAGRADGQTSSPPSPPVSASESATPAPGEVATGGTNRASAPTPSSAPGGADQAAQNSPAAVEVTVVPACVRPGSTFEVRMTSQARARLSMIIGYADNQPYGAMGFGDADAQGVFVWSVVAPAEVPSGQAKVLVGVQAEDGADSGSAVEPFEVAPSGTCA